MTPPLTTPPTPDPSAAGLPPGWLGFDPAELINYDELITEDGKPVESFFAEKQYALLTEPLYSCWAGPGQGRLWVAAFNVGWFYRPKSLPLVPDVLLSLDVTELCDPHTKEGRSYFDWVMGKPPDVGIEVVSNRSGDEEGYKRQMYARQGLRYYVIFDPEDILEHGVLRAYRLVAGDFEPIEPSFFKNVGLGVKLWQGSYKNLETTWLRWCDANGNLIPTGSERSAQHADEAKLQAERVARLAAQLRALGVEPEP